MLQLIRPNKAKTFRIKMWDLEKAKHIVTLGWLKFLTKKKKEMMWQLNLYSSLQLKENNSKQDIV